MVLYVIKYDIHPDKTEEFQKWTESAIQRILAVPGVTEFRAYRTSVGSNQVVCTFEFADMAAWAAWADNEDVKKVNQENFALALNMESELWGPSEVVPKPIRPRG